VGGEGGAVTGEASLLFKLVGAAGGYESRLQQISGSELSSSAQSFAAAGFVITATTTNTAGYTLWGFKPTGSSTIYESRLQQISGSELSSSAQSFAAAGFVITATTTNTAGYTLWGFKPR
jgi:hypothetical protein